MEKNIEKRKREEKEREEREENRERQRKEKRRRERMEKEEKEEKRKRDKIEEEEKRKPVCLLRCPSCANKCLFCGRNILETSRRSRYAGKVTYDYKAHSSCIPNNNNKKCVICLKNWGTKRCDNQCYVCFEKRNKMEEKCYYCKQSLK